MTALRTPNLPEKQAALCVAANVRDIASALKSMGIDVLSPAVNKALGEEVSYHPDMLVCHAGENRVFLEPSQTLLSRQLASKGFETAFSEPLGRAYPDDIKLNFAVSGDFILGNFAYADKTMLDYFNKSGKTLINVKQGYAKCSLCFVNENAFITEDEGIYTALKSKGKDVLLISKGDVYLSERHYGFFGGATGKLSPDVLALTGSIETHRDKEKITGFAKNHGVSVLELTSGRIMDIGGIIPMEETGN